MKKNSAERNAVVFLFILVLITFSFAQRDSEKLQKLYAIVSRKIQTLTQSTQPDASSAVAGSQSSSK